MALPDGEVKRMTDPSGGGIVPFAFTLAEVGDVTMLVTGGSCLELWAEVNHPSVVPLAMTGLPMSRASRLPFPQRLRLSSKP